MHSTSTDSKSCRLLVVLVQESFQMYTSNPPPRRPSGLSRRKSEKLGMGRIHNGGP